MPMAKEFEDYARECQQMEIGTKPIPISVVTAVTNSALNAASVFRSASHLAKQVGPWQSPSHGGRITLVLAIQPSW